MNKLNIFRIVTFLFGFLPSVLLCILAWILIESFLSHPTTDHIIQFLMALGGYAGTFGFAMAIFRTGRNKILTSFLLLCGITSMSWLIIAISTEPNLGHVIYGTILGLGVLSVWVEVKTQSPARKHFQQPSHHEVLGS